MNKSTASKLALAAILAMGFAVPAQAAEGSWWHRNFGWAEFWNTDATGRFQESDNYNNHVDSVKDDVAPHANISGFDATGVDPSRNVWEKMTPLQRREVRERQAEMRGMGMRPMHHGEHMMGGHMMMAPLGSDGKPLPPRMGPDGKPMPPHMMHKRMKDMTPEEKAAAKARWEKKKQEWDAMTPEQKAAAKARWDEKKAQ